MVAVVVGVSALGQQPIDARPPTRDDAGAQPAPSPESTASEEPSPSASPSPSPSKGRENEREEDRQQPLITEGVTVQVLNATGQAGADEAMVRRLQRLGFEVAAVVTAARIYDDTTVFWSSSDDRKAGQALARRFGWRSGSKPANLSSSVDVHVVVGRDER